jgi:hypothetical protein
MMNPMTIGDGGAPGRRSLHGHTLTPRTMSLNSKEEE